MAEHRARQDGSTSGAIRAADLLARFDAATRSSGCRHRAVRPAFALPGGALPAAAVLPRLPSLPTLSPADAGRTLIAALPRLPKPALPSADTGRTLIAAVSAGAVGVTAAIVATTIPGTTPAAPPTDAQSTGVQLAVNPADADTVALPAAAAAAFSLPGARPGEAASAVTGAQLAASAQPSAAPAESATAAAAAEPTAAAPNTRTPVTAEPDRNAADDPATKAATKAAAIAAANAAAKKSAKTEKDPAPAVGGSAALKALAFAKSEIGTPYRYGAAGPSAYDCSGLVMAAFKKAGVSLPRTSAAQSKVGTPVSRDELKPGDLVFFYSPVSHVGIYLGGGRMVHASTTGEPVKISDIGRRPFHNARRV